MLQETGHGALPSGAAEAVPSGDAQLECPPVDRQPTKQVAGSPPQHLPKQSARQPRRAASGRQASDLGQMAGGNSRPSSQMDSINSLQKAPGQAASSATRSEGATLALHANKPEGGRCSFPSSCLECMNLVLCSRANAISNIHWRV